MARRRRFGPIFAPGSPTVTHETWSKAGIYSSSDEEDEEDNTEPTALPMEVEDAAEAIPADATMPAGRTLRPCPGQAGIYEDVEDGQKFKVRELSGGAWRFVPIFEKRVQWKTSEGFKAMLLLLSCLGKEGEYVLIMDKETKEPVDETEWKRRKYSSKSKPLVWHKTCDEVVDSTVISSLQVGHGIGCSCHSNRAPSKLWENRYDEIVELGNTTGNFDVLTTKDEWSATCTGANYCPKLMCKGCGDVVYTTVIANIYQGQGIGCQCRCAKAPSNLWKNRYHEIVDKGRTTGNFEVITTADEWERDCTGVEWYPKLQCRACGDVVTTTSLNNLRVWGIGCRCRSNHAPSNLHKNRRPEFVELGKAYHFEVMTSAEEWERDCTGIRYCPKLQCLLCRDIVTTTTTTSLQQSQGIGCRCRNTSAPSNLSQNRRPEFVEMGKTRNFEVLTLADEWNRDCTKNTYCPRLQCTLCGEIVIKTSLNYLQQGGGVGCKGCRNKTEKKLYDWLVENVNSNHVEVVWGTFRGPGSTHFDFLLRSKINDYQVVIELDGGQHFWKCVIFTEEGCERDLKKEQWANERNICVIRILQTDVWSNRRNSEWIDLLNYYMDEAHRVWTAGEPARVFCAPEDAPEYTDPTSAYVRHHRERCVRNLSETGSNCPKGSVARALCIAQI